MFTLFLDKNTTYKTELRDFFQWHKGIEHFGFWAIEISNKDCLDKIKEYQDYFKSELHCNYSRQAHITIVASGLLSDDYFHDDLLKKQINHLKNSNIKPFSLQLANCNSFNTSPYLTIIDSFNNINLIRKYLNNTSNEVDLPIYIPHVTLGFYNNNYKTLDIVKKINNKSFSNIEFMVKEIVFAQYKTKDIQGPYEVLHRIKL